MTALANNPARVSRFLVRGDAKEKAMGRKPAKGHPGESPPTTGIIRKTFIIHSDAVEKAMDAAYWGRITLRELLERAIAAEITRMEKGNGGPFPKRPAPVKRGRPFAARDGE